VKEDGLWLMEVAEESSLEEVKEKTEADFKIVENLGVF